MMKLKYLILAFLLTFGAAALMAENEGSQQLVVWLKNGQKIRHDLADKPETRFNAGYLMLATSKVSVSYPLTDVLRYTFEGNIPVVSVPSVKPGEIRVMQNDNAMAFEGLPDGTRLEVFTLDGKKLQTLTARNGQRTLVSLQGQPAGTYLVKVGETTYKFMKR